MGEAFKKVSEWGNLAWWICTTAEKFGASNAPYCVRLTYGKLPLHGVATNNSNPHLTIKVKPNLIESESQMKWFRKGQSVTPSSLLNHYRPRPFTHTRLTATPHVCGLVLQTYKFLLLQQKKTTKNKEQKKRQTRKKSKHKQKKKKKKKKKLSISSLIHFFFCSSRSSF